MLITLDPIISWVTPYLFAHIFVLCLGHSVSLFVESFSQLGHLVSYQFEFQEQKTIEAHADMDVQTFPNIRETTPLSREGERYNIKKDYLTWYYHHKLFIIYTYILVNYNIIISKATLCVASAYKLKVSQMQMNNKVWNVR